MQQQPAGAPGAETTALPTEIYLPRGGTDPDFHFPADRGRRPGRVSRWINRLRVARSSRPPASAPQPSAPQ
jgi:hypothetical protein